MLIVFKIFVFALCAAITGYTYSQILTEPSNLLNGVWRLLDRKLPEWLFKPLMACAQCVSGQLALWLYVYACARGHVELPIDLMIMAGVLFIMLTIFYSYIIHFIYERIKNG